MQAQRSAKALVLVAILAFAPVAAFAADAPAKAQPVKAAAADPSAASTRAPARASTRYRAMRQQAAARPYPKCSFFSCPIQHILGIGF